MSTHLWRHRPSSQGKQRETRAQSEHRQFGDRRPTLAGPSRGGDNNS